MDNRVNVTQIAKDLDLSVSTVSRALSGSNRISKMTKERIQEYLSTKELVPNVRQKRYTDKVTNTISVVLPGERNFASMPYFFNIFLSVYDYFSIRGYQVSLIRITPHDISNLVNAVEKHAMDGVILSRLVENNEEIVYLKKMGVPFVVIGPYDDESVLRVDNEVENACYEITSSILQSGLTRIAVMCADRNHKINKIRLNGIIRAHVEAHMFLDRDFVFYDTDSSYAAKMAVKDVLASNIECIMCMDDNICMGILRELRKKDVKIPEDMNIVSLHNSPLLDEWYPSISCISYDVGELGKEASRILYEYLTKKHKSMWTFLGYEIQMKDSTT